MSCCNTAENCECCVSGPCGSEKCGCMGMSTYRIRSISLIVLAAMVEGCALSIHWLPYAWAECDEDHGGAVIMKDELYCVKGEQSTPSGTVSFSLWDENLRECSGSACPSLAFDSKKWKSVSDAAKDLGPAFGDSLAGFAGLIGFFAMLELIGYTLGSKCQAICTILFSIINIFLGILGALVIMGSGMLDEEFSLMSCGLCGQSYTDTHSGTPLGATTALLFAGILSVGTSIIGCVMLGESSKEVKYATVAPDRSGKAPTDTSL